MRATTLLLLLCSPCALPACRAPLPPELFAATEVEARERASGAELAPPLPGEPAPSFELQDSAGRVFELAALRGRPVVLTWFDASCPFLSFAYERGELGQRIQGALEGGALWLTVDSSDPRSALGAPSAGAGPSSTPEPLQPLLSDPQGRVGRRYGVTRAGETFVVAADGTLIYRGPLDNAPFGSVPGGGARRDYVEEALAALASGSAPPVALEPTYGSRIRYATR